MTCKTVDVDLAAGGNLEINKLDTFRICNTVAMCHKYARFHNLTQPSSGRMSCRTLRT